MSLRKQIRSKKYMDEVFQALELGERSRYGRPEFNELGGIIDVKFVGGVGTAEAIDLALAGETPEPEPGPWTITLNYNGGECLECGNAEGGEGFGVATGTTVDTFYNIFDALFGNLDKPDTDGWEYSYDEAGLELVGEEDEVELGQEYTIYVQWIDTIE
jgi:hypothetical protein